VEGAIYFRCAAVAEGRWMDVARGVALVEKHLDPPRAQGFLARADRAVSGLILPDGIGINCAHNFGL